MSVVNVESIEDIQNLIKNQVPESLNIEYKASPALSKREKAKIEISKDVSAMANSDGGIIIYGILEENDLPSKIDEGIDPAEIPKEWLEQIINSKIHRKIPHLVIRSFQISEDSSNLLYLVEVPQSKLAPHMAGDNRYYKRYNFQATPMEEYEVRDVSNRHNSPNIDVNLIIEEVNDSNLKISVDLNNLSDTPADHVLIALDFDNSLASNLTSSSSQGKSSVIDLADHPHNKVIDSKRYIEKISPGASDMPVFKGFNYILTDFHFDKFIARKSYLHIQLLAPYMEIKKFLFELLYNGITFESIHKEELFD